MRVIIDQTQNAEAQTWCPCLWSQIKRELLSILSDEAYNSVQSFHSDSAVSFAVFLHHLGHISDLRTQQPPEVLLQAMEVRMCACICVCDICCLVHTAAGLRGGRCMRGMGCYGLPLGHHMFLLFICQPTLWACRCRAMEVLKKTKAQHITELCLIAHACACVLHMHFACNFAGTQRVGVLLFPVALWSHWKSHQVAKPPYFEPDWPASPGCSTAAGLHAT